MSLTLRLSSGVVAVTALLLTGALSSCGVAGTNFHPGVAAQVGDEQVTVTEVDSIAGAYCSAIEGQLSGQSLPNRYLRGGVVGQLALVAGARQLAEEYDVEPDATYDQKLSDLQTATLTLEPEQREAVIAIESSASYVTAVLSAVGTAVLSQSGAPEPETAAATAAGQALFVAWFDDNDVEIDPQYGMEIKGGQAVPADTSISTAVGENAKKAQSDTPDPAYAAALPESLRCG